ncbi:Crp/Fnr family transcriptional regulator [Plantactinospora sp. S1510]|uniref:Crp/Fnr family transcriptional regulator n=2 Tax=Plantactinospora alkalitolerans TaxID=2789879 RepID=A0ABS0GTF1_9ACTN|nr:Crp/Fnr family transcriptional regulator [Plantactinospora alkalitolerans]
MQRLSKRSRGELIGLLAPARTLKIGEILLRQGDGGQVVYLLRSPGPERSACVKITARLENGSHTLLAIRIGGDLVGEMAVLRDVPRNATVTACARTLAHAVPNDTFKAFLHRCPDVWPHLYEMATGQLDWANLRRQEFTGYPIAVRLARVMLDLADRHGSPGPGGIHLGVRLSQAELGLLVGAREDAVSQALGQLRQAGLVSPRYRAVLVTDLSGLRHFASST